MLNVSPIGRSCSQEERIEFYELDKVSHSSWEIAKFGQRQLQPQMDLKKKKENC